MSIIKPNILIADDEEHVRTLLKMIAGALNYTVVAEAEDGEEAIELFRLHKPDIMILDINMPRMTGDEILEELGDELESTCTVMMTAIFDKEDVERCIELGAKHFIRKDTTVEKMSKIISSTWEVFAQKKYPQAKEKYSLNQLLNEIKEDKMLKNLM